MKPLGLSFKKLPRARVIATLAIALTLGTAAVLFDPRTAPHDATLVALLSGALPTPVNADVITASGLGDRFARQGYTLDAVRTDSVPVPRLFLAKLPADLPSLDSVPLRKEVFIKMLLPLVLAENERILSERESLLRLRDRVQAGAPLTEADEDWLAALAERYGVDDDLPESIAELVKRVDAVPPSLALGQAALETGWGTSDVAHRGQAMFGQMVDNEKGISTVRRFEHLAHAVEAYALNLNTHKAYARFRSKRAEMRQRGAAPDGYELALTLSRYSERKMDYVRDVRGIIKANKLRPLDQARLN